MLDSSYFQATDQKESRR